MAEYGRKEQNQLTRAIANNETGSRQLKEFVDNRTYIPCLQKKIIQRGGLNTGEIIAVVFGILGIVTSIGVAIAQCCCKSSEGERDAEGGRDAEGERDAEDGRDAEGGRDLERGRNFMELHLINQIPNLTQELSEIDTEDKSIRFVSRLNVLLSQIVTQFENRPALIAELDQIRTLQEQLNQLAFSLHTSQDARNGLATALFQISGWFSFELT